jgi:HK97 gp10 family phage protein
MIPKTGIYIPKMQLDEFERKTNQCLKELTAASTELLLTEAKRVAKRIKEKAPKGPTGNLKKSTYAVALPETTSQSAVAFAGIRPRKAPHAHLVEYGHGGPHPAPPHPFIRPAWDELKPSVEANLGNGLKKTIEGSF